MTKLSTMLLVPFAVLGAVASLASTATATTSTTPNPKTCNAAFLNNLGLPATNGNKWSLLDATNAWGGCLANATAGLAGGYGFTGGLPNALASFLGDNQTAAVGFVGASSVLSAAVNQTWWTAMQTSAGQCGPSAATSDASVAAFMSSNPCPGSSPTSGWQIWATGLPAGALGGGQPPSNIAPTLYAARDLYHLLADAFTYNALLGAFPYIPPCIPTACASTIVGLCNAPSNTALTMSGGAQVPILETMQNVFYDLNTYQLATYGANLTASGALLLQGIKAHNSAFIIPGATPFNCTQYNNWGASLSPANGGTKGDAASAARVGVLAAAVAVMAAAIAA